MSESLQSIVTERGDGEGDLHEASERLDTLGGLLGHELSGPLQVARANLEVARESGDSEAFSAVAQAHDRMERLIDELQTLSRQDPTDIDTEPVDLQAVVRDSWDLVETRQATLVCEVRGAVVANRCRLARLLENCFRNAVAHGGDSVTVVVSMLPDGFAVSDDGPGIEAELREGVVERGYSTEPSRTDYGLDLVSAVATAHDWSVALTESPAGGTQIEIKELEFAD